MKMPKWEMLRRPMFFVFLPSKMVDIRGFLIFRSTLNERGLAHGRQGDPPIGEIRSKHMGVSMLFWMVEIPCFLIDFHQLSDVDLQECKNSYVLKYF